MSISEQRLAVLAEAETWLKTPFHYQACVKGCGVACGPFLIAVYNAVGIFVDANVGHFPPDWHMHTTEERYLDTVRKYARPVESPQPADMVFFRVFKNRPFCHGGIVVDWPLIIHSADKRCVEYLDVSQTALGTRERVLLSPWV